MKLLLVEDESVLSQVLAKGLRKLGYGVDCALDGEQALDMLEYNAYDLMVLDLNLPGISGFEVLEAVASEKPGVKILILTAQGETDLKVKGFSLGANDYLTKPFDFQELAARIQALLRREFRMRPKVYIVRGLRVDVWKREVRYAHRMVELTRKEYAILEYLLAHMGQVTDGETLIEHVWDRDDSLFSNSLKFHISSLRKKLRECGVRENIIETVRGQGYVIWGDGDEV